MLSANLVVVYTMLLSYCSCHVDFWNFFSTKNETKSTNHPFVAFSMPGFTNVTLPRINDKISNKNEGQNSTIFDASSMMVTHNYEKHKFDYEKTDDNNGTDCVNGSTTAASEQEIDETNVCGATKETTTVKTTTTRHSTLEIDETKPEESDELFSVADRLFEKSKLPVPMVRLPIFMLPEQKTITITNTIIKPYTVYSRQYYSCILVEGATTWCENDQTLRYGSHTEGWRRKRNALNYDIKTEPDYDYETDTDAIRSPTRVVETVTKTDSYAQPYSPADDEFLAASEMDYDFEEIQVKSRAKATEGSFNKLDIERIAKLKFDEDFASVIGNTKIKFVNRYMSSTKTEIVIDTAIRATIVARDCIPRDSNMPYCSENFRTSFVSSDVPPVFEYDDDPQMDAILYYVR